MTPPTARSPVGSARRLLVCLALFALPGSLAGAEPALDAETRAKVIGQPVAVEVYPPAISLAGPYRNQQLLVSGRYPDSSVRDLTPFARFTVQGGQVVSVSADGYVEPRQDGDAVITVEAGGKQLSVPVAVRSLASPPPVSFRHDLIASLGVGGCNSGACHGTPSGKNGFKLSLRGYDPTADYDQLTRDVLGRRGSRLGPDNSLIYLKGLGRVPHEGGSRFSADSLAARVMHAWLAEGLRDDPADLPTLAKLEVLPGDRVLNQPARWQQLAVVAHFSNGETRDVTRLSVFSSSDTGVAEVNGNGLVGFLRSGEVAVLARYLETMVTVRLTYLEPKEGFAWNDPPVQNFVDQHVFDKLRMLNILPSDQCGDEEFVRRAYMDLCAVLPTAKEVEDFLNDKSPGKRAALIDRLLERPEYADFWTLKWSDVLRSSRKNIKQKGTHVFQRWLHNHVSQNTPLDRVVRELITGSGSTYSNPPANYYRISKDPTELAETTAQLFFGVRMQCAKCHNHPFERWTQDDYYSMAAFFARVKLRGDPIQPGAKKNDEAQYVYLAREGEVVQPRTGKPIPPRFLNGVVPEIRPGEDRRAVLAGWVTGPDNLFFAKSVVNRVWFHLTGRGIVDPVDDFRDSNPSANDALLTALAQDFVSHGFDVKHTIRTVMNSRTYQLSAQTNKFNEDDEKYFSHAVTKLYTAEQLFDALCQVTGVPEAFPGMPPGTRATQLPDGEFNQPFLKTFGQPARELACECERESDSNLAQALQLINGPAVNDRLRNPANRLGKLLAAKAGDRAILDDLYLASLARRPGQAEVDAMLGHVNRSADKRKAWEDVLWALINSKEFLFRH